MNRIVQKIIQLNGKLVNLIIALLGIILILLSILLKNNLTFSLILISIGTSILSSSIVTGLNSKYVIQESNVAKMIFNWGIHDIYNTRSEMNLISNELLKTTSYLDIIAMGLKNFKDAQSKQVENRVKCGLKIRIITINPDSKYLEEIDKREKVNFGYTKGTIEDLLSWVKVLQNNQKYYGQVEIRTYNSLPYEFYFSLDGALFVGPYHNKSSQQTITYQFGENGNGKKFYSQYFEELWSNHCEKKTFISQL